MGGGLVAARFLLHGSALVLIPVDLSPASRGAVALAALVGPRLAREIVLLHVCEKPPPLDVLGDLHDLAEPLREAGLQARLRTVRGEPVERIVAEARKRATEWVLLGTRGVGPTSNGQPGSVARAVMARAGVRAAAVRAGNPTGPNVRVLADSTPLSDAAHKLSRALAGALGGTACAHPPDTMGGADRCACDGRVHARVVAWDPARDCPPWLTELLVSSPEAVVLVTGPSLPATSK